MPDGHWNDDMEVLVLDQLHNNQTLINAFRANPSNAIAPFTLTAHERRAFVQKASNDFLALGVVDSVNELPEVIRGTRAPGSRNPNILDRIRDAVVNTARPVLDRLPRPPLRMPIPRPRPGTPPGPVPGPGPGPDPPGPDPRRADRPRNPNRG
jgi:hypothetical protein